MRVQVIKSPVSIVVPSQIPGDHAGDDLHIAALISAVQAGIDGPTGWLGRSLGVQELEVCLSEFGQIVRLPFRPIIDLVHVKLIYPTGNEQVLDPEDYHHRLNDLHLPMGKCGSDLSLSVRYHAGYDGKDHDDGGTGVVPASAQAAIILGVQYLRSLSSENLFLQSEQIVGVGTETYAVSERAGIAIKAATENLLHSLWIPSL